MVLSDPPASDAPLIQLLIIHIRTLAREVGSDSVGGATAFVTVPFRGIVFADPTNDIIGFLKEMFASQGKRHVD